MGKNKSLFDDNFPLPSTDRKKEREINRKEVTPLERLKNLEDKITGAIEKVKTLKEEKTTLERRIKELELRLKEKDIEIESLKAEKTAIKSQVEGLLDELDTLEVV